MDSPMWKLFIFDLDGTLMDSTHAEKMCYVGTFDRLGFSYDASRLDAYVNQSLEATYGEVGHGGVPYDRFVSDFMRGAQGTFDSNVAPFPETEEVLKGIRDMGIPMCIATRMGGRRARALLESFELDGYFDLIIGAEDVARHKPDPECVFKALDFHDVRAEDAVFVGDSPKDMYAAEAGGVEGILIDRARRYDSFGDHRIVRDLRELLF